MALEMEYVPSESSAAHGVGKGKEVNRDEYKVLTRKGTPNKRWTRQHTEYLFQVLVDEKAKANNPQKRFKPSSINRAVSEVNERFWECYTAQNVNNHLKYWKTKWVLFCQARDLSGAVWDDEKKMITLDKTLYWNLVRLKSPFPPWLNTPLPHYELLKIVCGDDDALGNGHNVVYQPYKNDGLVDLTRRQPAAPSRCEGSAVKSIGSPGTEILSVSSSRRRKFKDSVALDILIESVSKIATSIENGFAMFRNRELGNAIAAIPDYDESVLLAAFNKLYKDPTEAIFFIGMPTFGRIHWLKRFTNELASEGNANVGPVAPLHDK